MLSDRKHDIATSAARSSVLPPAKDLAIRYGTTGSQVILYTGTFEPYQGLELLVDAAPAVVKAKSAALFLCLGGYQDQIAALWKRACDKGVENHFRFPGVVPAETVETHFALAHILVSPRVSGTNTPLKIYSYLRSGIPILATNIRSHTQVLSTEVALLVEPNADAMIAGILTLLENGDLGQRLVHNALKLARERFSPEAYHAKVAQVYTFLEAIKGR